MDNKQIENFGDALYEAMVSRKTIAPLTEQAPDITVDDAYKISLRMLDRRTDAQKQFDLRRHAEAGVRAKLVDRTTVDVVHDEVGLPARRAP